MTKKQLETLLKQHEKMNTKLISDKHDMFAVLLDIYKLQVNLKKEGKTYSPMTLDMSKRVLKKLGAAV